MQIQKTNNYRVQNQQSFGLHIGKPCIETLMTQAKKGTDISDVLDVVKELKATPHARRYELREIIFDGENSGAKILDSLTGAIKLIKNAASSSLSETLKQFKAPGKVEQLMSEENVKIANKFVESMNNKNATSQTIKEIELLAI